ncbi:hypothetical protein JCM33374_g2255 [Metschnikowia sp. JCM 33374]|nr:hypothetical protein JCM33374_g2255 [Metschnikowia sp. JCM 33374]
MPDDICAFCLGGATEVPAFGSVKDAQDMFHPCSTCSLVTHRKCLIDWFNTIPLSHVTPEDLPSSMETEENAYDAEALAAELAAAGIEVPAEVPAEGPAEVAPKNGPNVIDISLTSRWFSILGQYSYSGPHNTANAEAHGTPSYLPNEPFSEHSDGLRVSTPCPQCKSKIILEFNRKGTLKMLTWNKILKNTVSDTIKYSGILLGLTGAATGVVTMGYVGLVRCGVSMIDAIVPVSLISPIFSRSGASGAINGGVSTGHAASFGYGKGPASDSHFLINHSKFQHIPLLPIMLYRMRYSSIFDCVFSKVPRAADWIGEALLCNYVSSLGNHTLVKQLYSNLRGILANSTIHNKGFLAAGLLFKNIDWWDPAVMVAATIPARWLYEFVYRLTANRAHFNISASIRPREIADSMAVAELSRLESLESQLAGVQHSISKRLETPASTSKGAYVRYSYTAKQIARMLRDGTFYHVFRLKVLHWYHKSKACLRHDYSAVSLSRSATMTCVTTFLWPFIAADLGKLIYGGLLLKIPSLASVDRDKLVLLSNLLGMAAVALLKDAGNLFLCYQKARQLLEVTVITQRNEGPIQRPPEHNYTSGFPGAYGH